MLPFFLVTAICGQAQKYTTAAGIRLGTGVGLTVQQAITKNNTIELIAQKGFFSPETTVTALYEKHTPLIARGLNFYIGAGPHAGFYKPKTSLLKPEETTAEQSVKIIGGISAIGGLEMKLKDVILSFDYKPALNIAGGTRFFDSQSAVSLRYVLIKAKKPERKLPFGKNKKQSNSKKQPAKPTFKEKINTLFHTKPNN